MLFMWRSCLTPFGFQSRTLLRAWRASHKQHSLMQPARVPPRQAKQHSCYQLVSLRRRRTPQPAVKQNTRTSNRRNKTHPLEDDDCVAQGADARREGCGVDDGAEGLEGGAHARRCRLVFGSEHIITIALHTCACSSQIVVERVVGVVSPTHTMAHHHISWQLLVGLPGC